MKKFAVTGATGFLGSNLVSRLVEEGYDVSGTVRDADKARALDSRIAVFVGDICDTDMLTKAFAGCECVFHTVSNFRTASGPPESYERINVQGTRAAIEAARAAGVSRFIHCSTIGVHGDVAESPATETSPFNPGDLYQETKLTAERVALAAADDDGMEVIAIRPCSMYGPGDLRMLKMFQMLSKKTFFKVGTCRENFHAAYIDDVVDGFMQAAATPEISGEVFIIGGPRYVPLEEYIDTAAASVGAPKPWLRLPYWLLYCGAWLCEKTFLPFGLEPPLHIRRVRFFKNNRAFSIDKARRVLKYAPKVDLDDGMKRTVEWYRDQELLP
jgi:nucleoside-diphosphate-sugar epimerase